MNLLLERDPALSGDLYTRGSLTAIMGEGLTHWVGGQWYTVERGLLDPTHPCIEPGIYKATQYYSPHNKATVWLLEDRNGRTLIEIHPANYPHELLGCIAPGKMFMQSVGGEYGVGRSKEAFRELMKLTKDETEITVEVKWKDANATFGTDFRRSG